jgi:hypothetical protein
VTPPRQSPSPPKSSLNSHAWSSTESTSAYVNRLRSGIVLRLSLRGWNLYNFSGEIERDEAIAVKRGHAAVADGAS